MVVGLPRADGGSDDDRVFVGCHGVLYVGQNEQEATNGMRLEVLKVERFAKDGRWRSSGYLCGDPGCLFEALCASPSGRYVVIRVCW